MYSPLSRRSLLVGAAAAAAMPGTTGFKASAAERPTRIALAAERRIIEVNGRAASVFGIRRPDGSPGIILDPGQRFSVDLANRCAEDTIVHWHGQTPPFLQDGVAETGGTILKPGTVQAYDFVPRPGTHWMHSHHGLQEQALMAAPLIVRTSDDLKADVQEVTVLLHDFSFKDPAELLAKAVGSAGSAMPGMDMGQHGSKPSGAGNPDLNDVDYDAYLANDRTLADPLVVRAAPGGTVRLRLINGATTTAFWIDTGELEGRVVAVDGNPVRSVTGNRFPLAQGQRLDVLITMPVGGGAHPVFAQREGDRKRTGIILASAGGVVRKLSGTADKACSPVDNSLEQRLRAEFPLSASGGPVTHRVRLTGAMVPYVWSLDDRTWADHVPLRVAGSGCVILEMTNETKMAHPMHLHGHHFQVIGMDGVSMAGAVRDTVLVPVNGVVTVAFDADNPGRWLFHCHNLFHMAAGMMTEVVYDGVA